MTETDPIRIVVVDDSALFRLLLTNVLNSLPNCMVVGRAKNGTEALEELAKLQPDLVTLDVEMPEMDGIETLRAMKAEHLSVPALMVSRLTEAGATTTTDALMEGAFDFIHKPTGKSPAENKGLLRQELKDKIEALASRRSATQETQPESSRIFKTEQNEISAVIIGTSTGGPQALRTIIPDLQKQLPVPVIIVQHMPTGYTARLAERLDELSAIEVTEAQQNDALCASAVFVAPGGKQMRLRQQSTGKISVELTDDPPENGCRPAVDYLLRSSTEVFGDKQLVVILTGMGKDGTEGCRIARAARARIVAQTADDCVVYGMPKSIVVNGLADEVVPLNSIASFINSCFEESRHGRPPRR